MFTWTVYKCHHPVIPALPFGSNSMKKQLSPAVIGAVLVIAVLVLAVVFYRQVVYIPPSAHPQLFGGPKAAGAAH
jgi:hypothetical protein